MQLGDGMIVTAKYPGKTCTRLGPDRRAVTGNLISGQMPKSWNQHRPRISLFCWIVKKATGMQGEWAEHQRAAPPPRT